MAVTWVDTPNVAISRREPLDFIVSTNPVAISVKFPSLRAEERVYRDGAFQYPYLNSTVTGSGPFTFHLNRTGGWPEDSTVYVDEGGEASADWEMLYSVDLTALATTGQMTPGQHIIDGKTWWLKGALGTATDVRVINGTGLNITTSFGISYVGAGAGSPSTALRWFMPLAQIPGFNPNLPFAVQFRVDTSASSGNRASLGGLLDCTDDAVGPVTGTREDFHVDVGGNTAGASSDFTAFGLRTDIPSAVPSNVTFSNGGASLSTSLYTAIQFARTTQAVSKSNWTNGFVSPHLLNMSNLTAASRLRSGVSAPVNPGFHFLPYNQVGSSFTHVLKNLAIWQVRAV
jgi:hypothetical protein